MQKFEYIKIVFYSLSRSAIYDIFYSFSEYLWYIINIYLIVLQTTSTMINVRILK